MIEVYIYKEILKDLIEKGDLTHEQLREEHGSDVDIFLSLMERDMGYVKSFRSNNKIYYRITPWDRDLYERMPILEKELKARGIK